MHRDTTILIGANGGAAAQVLSDITRKGERLPWSAPTHLAPLCQRGTACAGGMGPPFLLLHGHDRAGSAWGVGGVHSPCRSFGCAGASWCRSGETRRLTRSLSRTIRPARAARAGLPGDARTRVSAATDTG